MNGIVGASYPISDITFSSDGKMYVCEKVQEVGVPLGVGMTNLHQARSSRLFEYQKIAVYGHEQLNMPLATITLLTMLITLLEV